MKNPRKTMFLASLAIAVASPGLLAQPANPAGGGPGAPKTAAQQRDALAVMQESLAKQVASVQQQPGQKKAGAGDFFLLAPPASLGAVLPSAGLSAACDPLPSSSADALIAEAATREHLDEHLLRSVIQQESAFRPCAVSSKGAMGLMQLMPATAEQYDVKDPYDPEENVAAGAKMLHQLLTRYKGDPRLALGAYNAGTGAVDANDGLPPYRETIDYVRAILSLLPLKQ